MQKIKSITGARVPLAERRSQVGSTLVLIAAITMGLIVTLIFFGLNYTRLLGSNSEQKKAIESAALAAATDLSTIVIPTAEFGYVSLSDQAPIGKATVAGDQYYLPVRGINTLIGSGNRLVDAKDFVTSSPSVPYHVPTIVKAEADEIIRTSQTPNGATFHCVACAQPSSVFDVRPAPGAIAIEFPDGALPTLTQPTSLLTSAYLNTGVDCDTLSAVKDYPVDPGSSLDDSCPAWPSTVGQNKIADAWRIALYDLSLIHI